MYGEMSRDQIDRLLARHRWGRLGFDLDGEVYIIPINYAYDAGVLYGHAPEGTKVRAMRQNPSVAFEVDEIEDPAHWHSVLLHGRFVELHDKEQKQEAFRRILAQAGGGERSEASWAIDLEHIVIFRIEVTGISGRFEEREAYGLRPQRVGPPPSMPGVPPRAQPG